MGQEIQGTTVLQQLLESQAKIKSLRGGSRSSKTHSIIDHICLLCQDPTPYSFTITRLQLTWLKDTVLKDFGKIIYDLGWPIYPSINRRRSQQEYNLLDNEIVFMGGEDEGKLFGRSQDYFWMNECIELTKRHFDHLEMRSSRGGWLDYNPVGVDLWPYLVEDRLDVDLIESTILDNPFAPQGNYDKIMSYEETPENIANGTFDQYMWDVYGLGKAAKLEGLIYKKVKIVDSMPMDLKKRGYGLDFGFTNHPSALMDCGLFDGQVYIDEALYETDLTNPDMYREASDKQVDFQLRTWADDAHPKDIKELYTLGWRGITAAKKGDIDHGIQLLKQYPINITKRSRGMRKEAEKYKWAQDREGKNLNKPVDANNHGWDAVRYWAINNLEDRKIKPARVSVPGKRLGNRRL